MDLLKIKTHGLNIGLQVLSSINQNLRGSLFIKLPFYFYIFILITAGLSVLFFLNNLENSSVSYDSFFKQSIKFTFLQAILSTLISILCGFILSLCLYLSNFKSKHITIALNFFFIAPVLFISYGVIYIHGSNGLIQKLFQFLNFNYPYSFFGLVGIIYVTSFFNIALSANYFFRKLINIPENYLKLLTANKINLYLSLIKYLRPIILNNIIVLISMVLIFCISNFTIIYIFANSPLLTTIELAIYQKISFEANILDAVVYGLIQSGVIILILIPILKLRNNFEFLTLKKSEIYRIYQPNLLSNIILILFFFYFFTPCLVILKGLFNFNLDLLFSLSTLKAFLYSFLIAILSLSISLLIGFSSLFITRELYEKKSRLSNFIIFSIFILSFIPAISLSAILFLINFNLNFILPNFLIVSFVNSFLLTPLIFLFLFPIFMENNKYERLKIIQFEIPAMTRLKKIDFLKFKNELMVICSSCFVLSMGDLTSITLFSSNNFKTVPYLISQLYSSYRYDDAFFLLAVFVIFIVFFLYSFHRVSYRYVGIK
jgi:thiamine transport system permease protein